MDTDKRGSSSESRTSLSDPSSTRPIPSTERGNAEIEERVREILREEGAPPQPVRTGAAPGLDPVGRTETVKETAPGTTPSEPSGARPVKPFAEPIPARMLNEYVYCPRLFYYEFVEGIFLHNADTLRGRAVHERVDAGSGAMPPAPPSAGADESKGGDQEGTAPAQGGEETIHSRSVTLGSERLGVTAKLDLVEVRIAGDDLFAGSVCPVDYKAGAPKASEDGNEIWDADKMQLGLQALILRDNGYRCEEGIIFYRATRQRVTLPVTAELERWVEARLAEAREAATGPIPPPLVDSPKCPRCSLVTVCLPDETRMLAGTVEGPAPPADEPGENEGAEAAAPGSRRGRLRRPEGEVRRLIAARDDARPLYLNTQGARIGRKDGVLQIKEKDKVINEVRLRDVSHVALFGNIQISTQAVQSFCQEEIPVTYFSMGGWFYGLTRGHELKNVFLRVDQFNTAQNDAASLELARVFVHGKIRNHRTLLMRNHVEAPQPVLLKLKTLSEHALDAGGAEELLGIEGAAANFYFGQFGGMIKVNDELETAPDGPPGEPKAPEQLAFNFQFQQRNRRPPTDPVNALLSLAYSLLSKDCLLAAVAVGFDPYVGFYHQPRFGRPALALDLMEEFRPLIAESTVLNCINNRVITEKDFVRAGRAVNLTTAGRRRFFQVYEQRMSSLLTHPLFDYKVSYRRALELQARLLGKVLTREISCYVPLMTR